MANTKRDLRKQLAEIEAQGLARDTSAVADIIKELNHPLDAMRQTAAAALGQIGDSAAVPALMQHLHDRNAEVRLSVVVALGQFGSPQTFSGLIEALGDENRNVRLVAIRGLIRLGDQRAIPALQQATNDPDSYVARTARRAITTLGMMQTQNTAPLRPVEEPIVPISGPIPAARPKRKSRARPIRIGQSLRRWHLIAGIGLVLLSLIIVGWLWFWNRPLAPRLTTTASFIPQQASSPAETQPDGKPLCNAPPLLYILVVGLDNEGNYLTGSTDVIRILRVDFVTPAATLLAIPRDLWVPIPGMEQYGVTYNRITSVYAYGNAHEFPGRGPGLLVDTLAINFGTQVDRYLVASFSAFEDGIDSIGGVDLYVSEAVGEEGPNKPYFDVGWHHMDGATALQYVRLRPDNSSDLYRIDRQTELIAAVQDKVFSPQIVPTIPRLIWSTRSLVTTDLSPSEINMLVCIGSKIERRNLQMLTIDGSMVTSEFDEHGYEILIPNNELIIQAVEAFNAGPTP
ncbi:MAG: LCP family protein [Anaerolineae bacterium]|nr:LCP family protein [Anaerolineae bacterium]